MKHNIRLRLIVVALFVGISFSSPALAEQSSVDTPKLIQQLLAKISVLQTQLAQLSGITVPMQNTPTDGNVQITSTLSVGQQSDEVKSLQTYLSQFSDIYPERIVSGYFGQLTEQAVKRLQKTKGLEQVGIVGPKTRAIINAEITHVVGNTAIGGTVNRASTQSVVMSGSGIAVSSSTTTTASTSTSSSGTSSTPTPIIGDHIGPRITSLSISPTSVTPGGQVTFRVTADDVSGVANVFYDISYPGSSYVLRPNCNFNLALSGTCAFTQSIDIGISPTLLGSYVIGTVRATDGAGNTSTYYPNGTVINGQSTTHSLFIPAISVSAQSSSGGGGGGSGGSSTPTPDTTAPTVSFTSPTTNATVSGTITLTASASDNVGVSGVTFSFDGTTIGAEDSTSPYSVSFDTVPHSNGVHTFTAVARDAAGNRATSTVSVTLNNTVSSSDTTPPSVSISAPSNLVFLGNPTIGASASDDTGVVGVQFSIDGVLIGSEISSPPYVQSFSTTNYTPGSHVLSVVARDAAGNRATSSLTFYTYKSQVTFSDWALPSTVLSVGPKVISMFILSADAGGPIVWRKISMNYTHSSNVVLSDLQVFDRSTAYDQSGFPVPGALPVANVNISTTGNTITLMSSTDQELYGSKFYEIRAIVSGDLQAGDSVMTGIQQSGLPYSAPTSLTGIPSISSIVWSDLSAIPHSDASLDWNTDFSAKFNLHTDGDRTMTY